MDPRYRNKLLAALLVSGIALSALFLTAGLRLPAVERLSPMWIAALLAGYLGQMTTVAMVVRRLAPPQFRRTARNWMSITARHQTLFALLPIGFGDAGLPIFANRTIGMPIVDGVRVLFQLRIRDAIAVLSMALAGLAARHGMAGLCAAILICGFVGIWLADFIVKLAFAVMSKLSPQGRIADLLSQIATMPPASLRDRAALSGLTLIFWLVTAFSVLAAFRSIGFGISVPATLLFISAINLAGLIKVSVAGLGVAEAGATAALVTSGQSLAEAASLSLLIRPMLLVALLTACLILYLASRDRPSGASRP